MFKLLEGGDCTWNNRVEPVLPQDRHEMVGARREKAVSPPSMYKAFLLNQSFSSQMTNLSLTVEDFFFSHWASFLIHNHSKNYFMDVKKWIRYLKVNMFSLKLKSLLIKKLCPNKYFHKETIPFSCIKNVDLLEFPGSPVLRTQSFHWSGELKCCTLCGMAKKKKSDLEVRILNLFSVNASDLHHTGSRSRTV